jgi:hypothetical protein
LWQVATCIEFIYAVLHRQSGLREQLFDDDEVEAHGESCQVDCGTQGSRHANTRHLEPVRLVDDDLSNEQPTRVHTARAGADARAQLMARRRLRQSTPHPRGAVLLDDESSIAELREGAGTLREPSGLVDGQKALVERCQLAVEAEGVQLCHRQVTGAENGAEARHPPSMTTRAAPTASGCESVDRATC